MIEMTKHGVKLHGRSIPMANMEQKLLAYFMAHPNAALPREKIFREVWGYEEPGISRTIDAHIKKLREHLGKYRGSIVTVRGVGYRFEPENISPPAVCRLTDGGICCEMAHH